MFTSSRTRTMVRLVALGVAVLAISLVVFSSSAFADRAAQFLLERHLQNAPRAVPDEVPPVTVSQPWGWINGKTDAGASVTGTLTRDGTALATASATADGEGYYSFDFQDAAGHVRLQPGDVVSVSGGGLDTAVTVLAITGSIDFQNDKAVGQVASGDVPAEGYVKVGRPSSAAYDVQDVLFGNEGQFVADFTGTVDLTADDVALVVYYDTNGNAVQQTFFPEGLEVRILTIEGRVEGVTMPGAEVGVLVTDAAGDKATGSATADAVGFFSAELTNGYRKVSLALGDHVTITKLGHSVETDVSLHHSSYILPWSDRVVGNVAGVPLAAGGTQGRLELWSAAEDRWYSQYISFGDDGSYGFDYAEIVSLTPADVIRVTAEDANGVQQSVLGWALLLGASSSTGKIWGYSTAGGQAEISLYAGLVDNEPTDLITTATADVDDLGYFEIIPQQDGQPVPISPSNVVVGIAGEHHKTLFIGNVEVEVDVDHDAVRLIGPPNARVHLEGRRRGVLREDAPYQNAYVWQEVTLDAEGEATVVLSSYNLKEGDWFDVTYYGIEDSVAVHTLVTMHDNASIFQPVFLPLVRSDTDSR